MRLSTFNNITASNTHDDEVLEALLWHEKQDKNALLWLLGLLGNVIYKTQHTSDEKTKGNHSRIKYHCPSTNVSMMKISKNLNLYFNDLVKIKK